MLVKKYYKLILALCMLLVSFNSKVYAYKFSSIITNITCYGDSTGVVKIYISEVGTTPYTISLYSDLPPFAGGSGTLIEQIVINNNSDTAVFDTLPANSKYYMYSWDGIGSLDGKYTPVTQPTQLIFDSIAVTKALSCFFGNDAELTAYPTGGTPPYTYLWSNGDNTQTADAISQGNYTCTVNDVNGCGPKQSTLNFIFLNPLSRVKDSIPSQISVTNAVPSNACQDSANGSITVTASGGTAPLGSSAKLTTGADSVVSSNLVINGLKGGVYKVYVIDANGCQKMYASNVTVGEDPNMPVSVSMAISPDSVICEGTNVNFTATPTNGGSAPSYTWKLNGGTVGGSGNTYSNAALADGDEVYVILSSSLRCKSGDPATSNMISMDVNTNIIITVEPSNVKLCEGTNATLSLTATGSNPVYQWQKYSAGAWTNLSNGGKVAGATSNSLTISNIDFTYQDDYRCVISGSCEGDTSATVEIDVDSNAYILTNPVNRTICVGANTTFAVTASGSVSSYQWQVSTDGGVTFNNILAAGSNPTYANWTTATLNVNSVVIGNSNYRYRCIVDGGCKADTSNAGRLTVQEPPVITSQPSDSTVCEGDNAAYKVTATGTSLTYRWWVNTGSSWQQITVAGSNPTYANWTTANLRVNSTVASNDGYQYRCRVDNAGCPFVNSASADLFVQEAPVVTADPISQTICEGGNTSFSVTATGDALTYQWQVKAGAGSWTNISAAGVGPAYGGWTTATLTLNTAVIGNNGYQYRCFVGNSTCTADTSASATLTVQAAPTVTVDPVDSKICQSNSTSFGITATGASLTYQWQVNTGLGWFNISAAGSNLTYSNWTTATLGVGTVAVSNSGYLYRCIVYNATCSADTSLDATLTVDTNVAVSSQPVNVQECEGNNMSFSISATGSSPTYQWQKFSGSWNNLSNGGDISGATTATLQIANISYTDAGQFRCVVTGTCNSVNSNAATLVVDSNAAITSQPSNVTDCEGNNISFVVGATGTGLSYQWQKFSGSWNNVSDGGDISGATTNTLQIASINYTDAGQFRCVVTGTCSSVNSNTATLSVDTNVAITTHPTDLTQCAGTNVSFSITATGTNPSYQWQKFSGSWNNVSNGGDISGATTNTLQIATIVSGDAGQYRCVVTGTCNSVNSNPAVLTVQDAPVITDQPDDSLVCESGDAAFSVTATGTSLTYQWQVRIGAGAWTNISAAGSNPTYGGYTSNTLTLTGVVSANNNNRYRCIVDNSSCPSVTSGFATLTVYSAPTITLQPEFDTLCSGGSTTFAITATGTSISYQWQVDQGSGFVNISAAGSNPTYANWTTATLSVNTVVALNDGYKYRCVVSNAACSPATSNFAQLTVYGSPAISTYPVTDTVCVGNNTTFGVTASGSALTYQWQVNTGSGWTNILAAGSNPTYANWTTATLSVNSVIITNDNYRYRCIVDNSSCPSVTSNAATMRVYAAPSITSQPVSVTVCDGDNTSFGVIATGSALAYQWQVKIGAGAWTDITAAGVDPVYGGYNTATLSLTSVVSGNSSNQYRCIVSNEACTQATSTAATLTVQEAPNVTADPSNSTVCEGNGTSFTITADGTSLTYQWQYNAGFGWNNISAAGSNPTYSGWNTATLSLTGTVTGNNGYLYRCVVDNSSCPSDISASATLTVFTKPTISSNPVNDTLCAGDNTTFAVTASGTSLTYQWQVNTGSSWADITVAGSNPTYANWNTATLSVNGVVVSNDNYQYRCIVDNSACTSVTSTAARLRVNAAPAISSHPVSDTACVSTNTSFSVTASGSNLVYQWQVKIGAGAWNNISVAGSNPTYSGYTGATLTLTGVVSGNNGNQYRCIVDNSSCPSVTSNSATLTVYTAPAITTNPTNDTLCVGDNTTYSVVATGTALTYQWQVNTGSGWTSITAAGSNPAYASWNTATLSVNGVVITNDNYQYRCIVDNSACNSVTSTAARLRVNSAPAISTHPISDTVCETTNHSFSVVASGSNIGYQWQVKIGAGAWTPISAAGSNPTYSGYTGTTLTLTGIVSGNDGNQYRCVVSNSSCPSATSNASTLTVFSAPTVTSDPLNAVVCEGNDTLFKISATGTDLTYTWQVNEGSGWNNISAAGTDPVYGGWTLNTLSLTAVVPANDANRYRCIVDNSACPSDQSAEVTLTVYSNAAITVQPTDTSVCQGTTAVFSLTATGTIMSYQWQKFSGSWNNLLNGGDINGATSNTLQIANADATDNGQYRCVVTGGCNTVNSNVVNLTATTNTNITINPVNSTICEGSNLTLFTLATGTAPITYQWQSDSAVTNVFVNLSNKGKISGSTTSSMTISNIDSNYAVNYRCIVSSQCGSDKTSDTAKVTVNPKTSIVSQPTASIECTGGTAIISLTAVGTAPITYQWQKWNGSTFLNVVNGGDISGATSNSLQIANLETSDSGQYRCRVSSACGGAKYSDTIALQVNFMSASIGSKPPFYIDNDTKVTIKIETADHGFQYDMGYYLLTPSTDTILTLKKENPSKYSDFFACMGAYSNNANYTFTNQGTTWDDTLDLCSETAVPVLTKTLYPTDGWSKIIGMNPAEGGWGLMLVDSTNNVPGNIDGKMVTASISFTDTNFSGVLETIEFKLLTDLSIYEVPTPSYNSRLLKRGLQTKCFGSCDAQAIVNVLGGIPPFHYTWSDPLLPDTNEVELCADTFTVTVTDALGCSVTAVVTVTEPDEIVFNTLDHKDSLRCYGDIDTITVSAKGGTGTLRYSVNGSVPTTDSVFVNIPGDSVHIQITDDNGCIKDTTIFIYEPDSIQLWDSLVNLTCFGNNSGKIFVFGSGGNLPYDYTINNTNYFDSTNYALGLAAGSYLVRIKDSKGCMTRIDSVTLTEPIAIDIDTVLFSDSVLCNNDTSTIRIYASGGVRPFMYSVDTATAFQADSVFEGVLPGRYIVAVRDVNNCTMFGDTLYIYNPLELSIDSVNYDHVECNGDSTGNIEVFASGGSGIITYTLNPGAIEVNNDGKFNNLYAGNYTILVEDANGCDTTLSYTITEPAPINDTAFVNQHISCYGFTDGIIQATASGGTSPYKYMLYDPAAIDSVTLAGTASFDTLKAGMYFVVATDMGGCKSKPDTVVITQPDSIRIDTVIYYDTVLCYDDSTDIIISASGASGIFKYSLNNGVNYQLDSVFYKQAPGQYIIAVMDTVNGCVKTGDTITIVSPLPISVDSLIIDSVLCGGDTTGNVEVYASGGTGAFTFTLNPGAKTNSTGKFPNLGIGAYTITITDASGCDTVINVSVEEPAPLTISSTKTDITCYNLDDGTIIATASGGTAPYKYVLFDVVQEDSVISVGAATFDSLDASTTHYVEVTDVKGCMNKTAFISIINPDSLYIQDFDSTVTCTGFELTIHKRGGTAPFNYYFHGSSGSSQADSTNSSAANDTFRLAVVDANGCKAINNDSLVVSKGAVPVFNILKISKTDVTGCYGDASGSLEVIVSEERATMTYTLEEISTTTTVLKTTVTLDSGDIVIRGLQRDTINKTTSVQVHVGDSILEKPSNTKYFVKSGDLFQIGLIDTIIHSYDSVGVMHGNVFTQVDSSTNTTVLSTITKESTNDTLVFTGLKGGTYRVSVLDTTKNCTTSPRDTIINQPPQLVFNIASKQDIEEGKVGSISVQATGGSGNLNYVFDTNSVTFFDTTLAADNTVSLSPLLANTYNITVKDTNNCTASTSLTISIIVNDLTVVVDSVNRITCPGDNDGEIYLRVLDAQGPPYNVDFYLNDELVSNFTYTLGSIPDIPKWISGRPAGFDTIKVVDNVSGRKWESIVEVGGPIPIHVDSTTIVDAHCKKILPGHSDIGYIRLEKVSGGNSSYSTNIYNWDRFVDGAWVDYATATTKLSGLLAGTYRVSIQDLANCPEMDTIFTISYTDSVEGYITANTLDLDELTICHRGSADLNVKANLWVEFVDWYELVDTIRTQLQSRDKTTYPLAFSEYDLKTVVTPMKIEALMMSENYCTTRDTINMKLFDDIYIIDQPTIDDITMISNNGRPIRTAVITPDNINSYSTDEWDVFVYNESPATNFKWYYQDLVNPVSTEANYTLTADLQYANVLDSFIVEVDNINCKDRDTIYFKLWDGFIPNGFTPNGDGINDEWEFSLGSDKYVEVEVNVFNRWGEKVYVNKLYEDDGSRWNGKRNGKDLPAGTYYYIIVVSDGVETIKYSGPLTIIR